MTDCVTDDRLADLLSVLDVPASATLDHLASCSTCRERIADFERVRGLLRTEEPAPAAFVDGVMRRIGEAGAPVPVAAATRDRVGNVRPRQRSPWRTRFRPAVSSALAAVSAGVATSLVLIAAGSASSAGVEFGPVALWAGVLFGSGLAVHELVTLRRQAISTAGAVDQ